jgi:hypothetical protein
VKKYLLISLVLILLAGTATGCNLNLADEAEEVTFDELFARPEQYDGKVITLEGYYFHGFEIIVLAEKLESGQDGQGSYLPQGRMLWIDGGIPVAIYDKLQQQQRETGGGERYGRVKITGEFSYGGEYGHLGAYTSQITTLQVILLSYIPAATM